MIQNVIILNFIKMFFLYDITQHESLIATSMIVTIKLNYLLPYCQKMDSLVTLLRKAQKIKSINVYHNV